MKCSFALSLILSTTMDVMSQVMPVPVCYKEPHVDRRMYYEQTTSGLVSRSCSVNTVFVWEECGCNTEHQTVLPRQQVPDEKKAEEDLVIEHLPAVPTRSRSRSVTQQSHKGKAQQQQQNQQYMTDILRVSWRLLIRAIDVSTPLAVMKKPCPCGVNCCAAPTEPRRVLQFVDVPMAKHPGCCGCVDCPPRVVSLAPLASDKKSRRRLRISRRRGTRIGGRF